MGRRVAAYRRVALSTRRNYVVGKEYGRYDGCRFKESPFPVSGRRKTGFGTFELGMLCRATYCAGRYRFGTIPGRYWDSDLLRSASEIFSESGRWSESATQCGTQPFLSRIVFGLCASGYPAFEGIEFVDGRCVVSHLFFTPAQQGEAGKGDCFHCPDGGRGKYA